MEVVLTAWTRQSAITMSCVKLCLPMQYTGCRWFWVGCHIGEELQTPQCSENDHMHRFITFLMNVFFTFVRVDMHKGDFESFQHIFMVDSDYKILIFDVLLPVQYRFNVRRQMVRYAKTLFLIAEGTSLALILMQNLIGLARGRVR